MINWCLRLAGSITLICFALALLFTPTASAMHARATSASALPCRTAQLRGGLVGVTGGAGTFVELFVLQNVNSRECSIAGYARLRFYDVKGRAVEQGVRHQRSMYNELGVNRLGKLPVGDLKPHGGIATFWISEGDIATGQPPAPCHQYQSVGVGLPHESGWVRVVIHQPRTLYACTGVTELPMVPGRSGSLPHQSVRHWLGPRSATSDAYDTGWRMITRAPR